jgi:predicted dehydrogenase
MTPKLRVGVIGAGYLGRIHARIYRDLPGVELVGVADVDTQVAAGVAREYGCAAYRDARELLGRVDAVSIVVPTVHHLTAARPLLEAGVHMLMEKPLAASAAEGLELVELAERRGVVFQVGHQERYNAGLCLLAERVTEPRFIEATRIGGFVERATDVDVITDLMIHDIDIVLALVPAPLRDVEATGVAVLTEHVDIANARLRFDNGAVANLTASRVSTKKQRRIRVFSHHAYYALDSGEQSLEIVRAVPNPAGGRPLIESERPAFRPQPPLDAELADFVDAVRQRRAPRVNGRTGLAALRVALAIKDKIAACPPR